MSENTKIEWATSSWNPWIGCTKVSPGCLNCYAEKSAPTRVARADGRELWGKGYPRQRTSAANWKLPIKWNIAAGLSGGERPRIFPSLCDWLDDEVPIEWLADLLRLIYATPNLDWLLLTKRPGNFKQRLSEIQFQTENADGNCLDCWLSGEPPENVWAGGSVEDQTRADQRIPALLQIPARIRFLSVEPMLEMIDFTSHFLRARGGLHWVIFGGESGPGARPCNIGWIRAAGTQCRIYHILPYVKQVGSYSIYEHGSKRGRVILKHPKGGDPSEWPDDLRVREFPEAR
jgi:protein gp37